jgi:hypothetical protein
MIVAIAGSEDQARELMSKEETYDSRTEISCHPITNGLVIANYGDF